MKIMVINGPDIDAENDCGTLESLNGRIAQKAEELGISCEFFKSESEGGIVALIQSAWGENGADGVILNAGKFADYSIAIRDAIASINKPVVEVQLKKAGPDEEPHRVSVLSAVCKGVISGFGRYAYFLALYALAPESGVI